MYIYIERSIDKRMKLGVMPAGGCVSILFCVSVFVPVLCDFPVTLSLERAFPTSHGVEMSQLRALDSLRHSRILQSSAGGVVDFELAGTYIPSLVGLYFTRVQLGSPPKEYYVQIDTGSDVLWVSCSSCNGCPTASGLDIQLETFDPSSSSTASLVSCSDQRCALGAQTSDSACSRQSNQCSYTFQYGDGSGTSGFYVADLMHFDMVVGNSVISNTTAPVVFGCSTSQTGDLTKPDRAVDGIFGFGQQGLSVISQLSSQAIVPDAFSHCLRGGESGGGILVFGQIVEPNLVYTPLVPSQPHYNVNLLGITVNGQSLPIDPSVFSTSGNRGTIIDSGTTLAYLADEVYDPFVNAITQAVQQSVNPFLSRGSQCFFVSSSVSQIFPAVTLNFAGGASMFLKPEDYLLKQNSVGGATAWCIGFQKLQGQDITILGDLVLKDKIVVYDLGGQRIGWADYDCSLSVNVSTTSSSGTREFVNAGQIGGSSSLRDSFIELIPISIISLILHASIFYSFPVL